MTKPRTIQGTPDPPEPTPDLERPEGEQAERTASADALLAPNTARDPSLVNH